MPDLVVSFDTDEVTVISNHGELVIDMPQTITGVFNYNVSDENFEASTLSIGLFDATGSGPGAPGPRGPQGDPGVDGVDGTDGTDGVDGVDGADGQDAQPEYPGVTVIRSSGQVANVEYYLDAAKTDLEETATIVRTLGVVSSVQYRNDASVLTRTKVIERDISGAVIGVTIV